MYLLGNHMENGNFNYSIELLFLRYSNFYQKISNISLLLQFEITRLFVNLRWILSELSSLKCISIFITSAFIESLVLLSLIPMAYRTRGKPACFGILIISLSHTSLATSHSISACIGVSNSIESRSDIFSTGVNVCWRC